jgi:CheY-like chemotaxis protein
MEMGRVKVLLVDDDKAIRGMLRIALSLEDGICEVREARDGGHALRILDDYRPDVVFLDYWMPVLDGGSVARHIRGRLPDARIVAFSGALETKPDWADHLFVKGRLTDLDELVALTRR